MLRRLYDWTLELADTRHALWALAVVAFVESSVFPVPPHLMVVPMVLAAPQRAWLIALVCTAASVAGGMLGYWIGAELFDSLGRPVLEFYGKAEKFEIFRAQFNEYGAWAVLFAGITPFPYKVITITSGATGLDFGVFMLASVLARGFVFFLLAAILWKFGPPVRAFIEKRFALVTTAAFAALLGGFALVRFL
ncbi:DedA family protein [Rhodobacteraceae bacterium 2CG4]|uniref:DedA family protein n=1 Tax=Halovulum marinum TaxID=2662447 RepID=A0A6L5Z571_9RHOB|nr:YqaA family protein [Halovulum marinum]MSU91260.1 DedA family protein [Halovulum marinum]